ncbi:uncharacterized protein DS421_20g705070 [Arachis hypogaea]|nr:uncharacterized protein DS421_20g705070 [Arachis hypogaea]
MHRINFKICSQMWEEKYHPFLFKHDEMSLTNGFSIEDHLPMKVVSYVLVYPVNSRET